jgi:hypothetical protein
LHNHTEDLVTRRNLWYTPEGLVIICVRNPVVLQLKLGSRRSPTSVIPEKETTCVDGTAKMLQWVCIFYDVCTKSRIDSAPASNSVQDAKVLPHVSTIGDGCQIMSCREDSPLSHQTRSSSHLTFRWATGTSDFGVQYRCQA